MPSGRLSGKLVATRVVIFINIRRCCVRFRVICISCIKCNVTVIQSHKINSKLCKQHPGNNCAYLRVCHALWLCRQRRYKIPHIYHTSFACRRRRVFHGRATNGVREWIQNIRLLLHILRHYYYYYSNDGALIHMSFVVLHFICMAPSPNTKHGANVRKTKKGQTKRWHSTRSGKCNVSYGISYDRGPIYWAPQTGAPDFLECVRSLCSFHADTLTHVYTLMAYVARTIALAAFVLCTRSGIPRLAPTVLASEFGCHLKWYKWWRL